MQTTPYKTSVYTTTRSAARTHIEDGIGNSRTFTT